IALAQTPRETPDWTGYYSLAIARELAGSGLKQDFPNEELQSDHSPPPALGEGSHGGDRWGRGRHGPGMPAGRNLPISQDGRPLSVAAGARSDRHGVRPGEHGRREANLPRSSPSQEPASHLERPFDRPLGGRHVCYRYGWFQRQIVVVRRHGATYRRSSSD